MDRVVLITDNELRHRYVATNLKSLFPNTMVIHEQKEFVSIGEHFAEREKVEKKLLSDGVGLGPRGVVIEIPKGTVSTDLEIRDKIAAFSPDIILFYGCSIIKKSFIDAQSVPLINVHLGLSPYYRGAGTNFWPIFNEEPEYVGITYHFLDENIDTGRILAQRRLPFFRYRNVHEQGMDLIKSIPSDLRSLLLNFKQYEMREECEFHTGPRLYYKASNFSEDSSAFVERNFERIQNDFLERYKERMLSVPIMGLDL